NDPQAVAPLPDPDRFDGNVIARTRPERTNGRAVSALPTRVRGRPMQSTSPSERGRVDPSERSLSVPFFSQAASFERIWPKVERHLTEVTRRGKYSHGHKVAEFEEALAAY